MDTPYLQTGRQAEIVKYADEHPELSQEAIAAALGIGRTSVSRVLVIYRPDRPKLAPGGIEAKITREIRQYREAHPDMGARAIAEALGYSKYRVEQAIRGMEAASCGRKKKQAVEYTLKPCLKCGKPHKSTWAGDRNTSTMQRVNGLSVHSQPQRLRRRQREGVRMFEIRSAKQFVAFLLGFLAAGSAWLALCRRGIERIMRGRR